MMTLTVIIPVYNEASRVQKGIKECYDFFKDKKYFNELIIVDDGSKDNTFDLISEFAKNKSEVKVKSYEKNQGRGFAVKKGIETTNADWILITDIDLSVPLSEWEKFENFLNSDYDFISSSRRLEDSLIKLPQPKIRDWLGYNYRKMVKYMFKTRLTDFTCGFKLIKTESANKLIKYCSINHWGFDTELLLTAEKMNFKIKEIGIIWLNDSRSKVKIFHAVITSFIDLMKIYKKLRKNNDLRRIY